MQRPVLDPTPQVQAFEPIAARDAALPAAFLAVAMVAIAFGALLFATAGAAPAAVPSGAAATSVIAA